MKKIVFLVFDLTFMVMFVLGCGNTPTPALTSTFSAPTVLPSAIATLPLTRVPSQTLLPFEAISEMSPGEFLFVDLHDDDFTCLDGLCACPVPEMPPDSFKFEGDQLLLIKYHFEPMPADWIAFRKNRQASILYSFYGSQVSELRLFSSLPLMTSVGNFVIRSVNARGEILVQTPDGTRIVVVGGSASSQEPAQREEGCKVLHKYSLTNYGFMKDENVRLVTGW